MRLSLRLLTIVLLLAIAGSTKPVSRVCNAGPCEDGCWRGYQICMGETPPDQTKCEAERKECMKKCGSDEGFEIEEPPAN